MSKRQSIWTLGMLAFALSGAWAQDSSTPPASTGAGSTEQLRRSRSRRMGRRMRRRPISENPPLSGLDLPSLEPHAAPLSYLQPGATFSESADSNAANALGGAGRSPRSAAGWEA